MNKTSILEKRGLAKDQLKKEKGLESKSDECQRKVQRSLAWETNQASFRLKSAISLYHFVIFL